MDDKIHIDFNAPRLSENGLQSRVSGASTADRPYLIVDGTLDDCIRQFMAKPVSQHHLHDIQTAPAGRTSQRCLVSKTYLRNCPVEGFSLSLKKEAEKPPFKSKPLPV